jgi:hypothetical protein
MSREIADHRLWARAPEESAAQRLATSMVPLEAGVGEVVTDATIETSTLSKCHSRTDRRSADTTGAHYRSARGDRGN